MTVVIPKIAAGLKPTFSSPATVYLPGDGGEHVAHKFNVHFKRLKSTERDELSKKYIGGEINTAQLLDAVAQGWDGMLDEIGNPVPYSKEVRTATEAVYSGVEQAMAVSWFDHAFINQREAAIKNLKALSGTGTA